MAVPAYPPQLLFERAWQLQLIPPLQSQLQTSRYAIVFSSKALDTPLRFEFACERSLMSEPNKGTFTLTNLATSTASAIKPGTLIVLDAGYQSNVALIYKGEVVKVSTTRDGPDTSTVLECGDGEPYVAYSQVQLSYKGNVTLARVVQDVAKAMRVSIGGQVYQRGGVIVQGLPNKTFVNRTVSGLTRDILDGLLHPFGISWSIQSGVLLIQNSKGILNLRSTVLNERSGLIGQVSRTDMGMSCQTLMIPTIVPGSAVTVEDADKPLNGNYRVVKATYKGDTMGQDWSIDIEAQPLVAPLAAAPATKPTVPPTSVNENNLAAGVDPSADTDGDGYDEAAS